MNESLGSCNAHTCLFIIQIKINPIFGLIRIITPLIPHQMMCLFITFGLINKDS